MMSEGDFHMIPASAACRRWHRDGTLSVPRRPWKVFEFKFQPSIDPKLIRELAIGRLSRA